MKPTRLLQCLNPHISPDFDLKVDKISVGSSNSKQPDLNYNKTIGDWMINDV